MKIVKFEEFHVDCGWEIYSFLKISTGEGLTGWSEFKEHRRPGIGAAIQGMGEILIGQDPRAIGRIDAVLGWRGYDALITRDNLVMGAV